MYIFDVTKEEAEKVLLDRLGSIQIACGQDMITLYNVPASPMKREIMIYVNGKIKGEWIDINNESRESQYLRVSTKKLYSKKDYDKASAKVKKQLAEAVFQTRTPAFSTPKSAIRHILKVYPTATFKSNLSPV